jgi:3-oxoacyl-[acyl-carrier protein] reductase
MSSLTNKIALITGASRGIGKAIAVKMAQEGATVIVHYASDESSATQTLREIADKNQQAFLVKADLQKKDGVDKLFAQVDTILNTKKLDILVNNAGILVRAGLHTITEDQYDRMFDINVKAPFLITARALTRINNGGRIINISSQVSKRPRYEVGAYSMTKAAIDNFTMSLASVLGERKITVNAVAPGITDTDMNKDKLVSDEVRSAISQKIALKRIGTSADIADVVHFLATDAGGWITGQYIEASGGSGLIHT